MLNEYPKMINSILRNSTSALSADIDTLGMYKYLRIGIVGTNCCISILVPWSKVKQLKKKGKKHFSMLFYATLPFIFLVTNKTYI